mmetsp:Transcript_18111/g.17435  ORF Transcript_18111/g.17435 Transcript_18111/m.17435 type:complete len:242 (-) Transcript_18111:345-1070(-)
MRAATTTAPALSVLRAIAPSLSMLMTITPSPSVLMTIAPSLSVFIIPTPTSFSTIFIFSMPALIIGSPIIIMSSFPLSRSTSVRAISSNLIPTMSSILMSIISFRIFPYLIIMVRIRARAVARSVSLSGSGFSVLTTIFSLIAAASRSSTCILSSSIIISTSTSAWAPFCTVNTFAISISTTRTISKPAFRSIRRPGRRISIVFTEIFLIGARRSIQRIQNTDSSSTASAATGILIWNIIT